MSSATPTFQTKIQALATPQIDPTSPIHAYFLLDKMKQMHGALESRLYSYLNPKNAALCTKLVYAIPANLAIKILSRPKTIGLSLLSTLFLWRCKKETLSSSGKILLLHSITIGLFANILNSSLSYSKDNLLTFSLNASLMTACFIAANSLENPSKVEKQKNTGKLMSQKQLLK